LLIRRFIFENKKEKKKKEKMQNPYVGELKNMIEYKPPIRQ
jgi:hypothetical protein